jgi:hypothetical protein
MDARITPSTEQDNLADLAERIRVELQAAKIAWNNALGHALNIGQALLAAQPLVSGNWKRWLRDNCALSVSTAQLYQQLARHRDEIEAEISRAPDLSLRAARRLISKPKSEPAPRGKRSTARRAGASATPTAVAIDPAIERLAGTLTKLLRVALSHQAKAKNPATELKGILAKLRTQKLEPSHLHIAIDIHAHRRRRVAATGI